jgi:hypothetical protein
MKSFTWRYKSRNLFGEITEIVEENNGVIIARYTNENLQGLYNPLVKIDTNRNKVHFLDEASFQGLTNYPQFDRGRACQIYK